MKFDVLGSQTPGRVPVSAVQVSISKWVNQPLPPLDELLSSHDMARLTRRPRFVVVGLSCLGFLPRRRRYRGCVVGWLRSDVLDWMSKDLRVASPSEAPPCPRRAIRLQKSLPLKCRTSCAGVRTANCQPTRKVLGLAGSRRSADARPGRPPL